MSAGNVTVGDMVLVSQPVLAMSWMSGPGGEHTAIMNDLVPVGEMLMVIDNFEISPEHFEAWWINKRRRVIISRESIKSLEKLT